MSVENVNHPDNVSVEKVDVSLPTKTNNIEKDWSKFSILLCTANVGSLFENVDGILPGWLHEFSKLVETSSSHFIALHMQEVGGKDYEQSMEHVDIFVKELLSLSCFQKYLRFCIFMNTDFTDQADFTALGSVYFISNLLVDVNIWNFHKNVYHQLNVPIIYSGNNSINQYVNHHKYERSFFPVVKWSRKGFLHTKWRISNSEINFVNIHLFHDPSNFGSILQNGSIYTKYRTDALWFTIERIGIKSSSDMAIFGDFNFRLNTYELIKNIIGVVVTEDKLQKSDQSPPKFQLSGDKGEIVVIKKKYFSVNKAIDDIFHNDYKQILPFDVEINEFKDIFNEFKTEFPPSYPYSEDVTDGSSFMKTRCPSWCDRVLFTHSFIEQIELSNDKQLSPQYGIIGKFTCMGDHKPVYLTCHRKDLVEIYSNQLDADLRLKSEIKSITINDNECAIDSDWSVHDYAHFSARDLLTIDSILNSIKKEPNKRINFTPKSRKVEVLWTKLKAVSIFVGAAHRRGSWYTVDNSTNDEITNDTSDEVEEIKHVDQVDYQSKRSSRAISVASLSNYRRWNELARNVRRERAQNRSRQTFFNRICDSICCHWLVK